MNEALSRLSEYNTFFVWVLEKNERAIEFYHKYGFEFDGCKKNGKIIYTISIPSNCAAVINIQGQASTKVKTGVHRYVLDNRNLPGIPNS